MADGGAGAGGQKGHYLSEVARFFAETSEEKVERLIALDDAAFMTSPLSEAVNTIRSYRRILVRTMGWPYLISTVIRIPRVKSGDENG